METEPPSGTQRWAEQYRLQHGVYQALAERVQGLLSDLLTEAGIDVVQVEARAKSVDSFAGKLKRKREKYSDPLSEVTDLAGVRVIAYYLEDLVAIGDLIRAEFDIDEANTVQRGAEEADRFGYVSDHYVVGLGDVRRNLAEWKPFVGKCVEIQVRTATQHAWAAIEHKLRYKSAVEVPDDLRRRLSRLSALFELADEQFSLLRAETATLEKRYAESLTGGDLGVPLDASSLVQYLEGSEATAVIVGAMEAVGIVIRQSDGSEEREKRQARDRRDLLRVLHELNVTTIGDLDGLLRDVSTTRDWLTRLSRQCVDAGWQGLFLEDFLTMILLVFRHASDELIQEIYSKEFAEFVSRLARDGF